MRNAHPSRAPATAVLILALLVAIFAFQLNVDAIRAL